MTNSAPRTREDCKKQWTYEDDNGRINTFTNEEVKKLLPQWIEEDFFADSEYKIDTEIAYHYFFYEYDEDKLKEFYINTYNQHYSNHYFSVMGLIKMFNDGFLKSPAFVRWDIEDDGFKDVLFSRNTRSFINSIWTPQLRIDIISYFKKISKSVLPNSYKEANTRFDVLLAEAKESLKVEKAEAAIKKKAQQKSTTPKPAPEYSLSLDEIIAYANSEGKAHAEAIRSMLRYFKDEKDGWDNAKVKKLIHEIQLPDSKTFNITQANQVVGNLEKQDIHHD